jgi:hypothetical protein
MMVGIAGGCTVIVVRVALPLSNGNMENHSCAIIHTTAKATPAATGGGIIGTEKWIVWIACNLTAFIHSSTGSVVHPFASCHEGPRFSHQGGSYVKPEFSC